MFHVEPPSMENMCSFVMCTMLVWHSHLPLWMSWTTSLPIVYSLSHDGCVQILVVGELIRWHHAFAVLRGRTLRRDAHDIDIQHYNDRVLLQCT
jgi:hypothetical protein